jgi:hypothetical protein
MQGGMDRREAIARLKQHEAEFRQLGVEHLYLVGSTTCLVQPPRAARHDLSPTLTCSSIILKDRLGFTN